MELAKQGSYVELQETPQDRAEYRLKIDNIAKAMRAEKNRTKDMQTKDMQTKDVETKDMAKQPKLSAKTVTNPTSSKRQEVRHITHLRPLRLLSQHIRRKCRSVRGH